MRITLAIAICISVLSAPIAAQQKTPLRLVQTINLPGVHGRMDHMDVDVQGKRLFVAALESGSVEIVDLARASWHKSIGGFLKPQGVLYVEPLKKLFVASGDDGMVRVFNGKSLQLLSSIQLEKGSNRVTYDPLRKLLYVGSGGKDAGQNFGRVAVIDAKSHKIVGNVKVTAHPAELLLDSTGDRLFVFIPIPSQIQVVDARTLQVIST